MQTRLVSLRAAAQKPHRGVLKKVFFMGDVLSLLVGVVIFAVLILYVPACEKV